MTEQEKEIIKDLFRKFKDLYNRQKMADDLIERMLTELPEGTIPSDRRARWEEGNSEITEHELSDLENKINNL